MSSISVVIPCYNARRWIGATIASVQAQTRPPEEIIVVDDGSSDGSADWVEAQGSGVRVLRQANAGVAAARNHGALQAQGEWIAFVDADDIWLPDKLRRQVDALAMAEGASACYTAWQEWPSTEEQPPPELLRALASPRDGDPRWQGPSGWIYADLLLECCVWTSVTMLRRSLFELLGGFDPKLRIGEDYDLWLRLSRVSPIVRVPAPLALYRLHPASITRRLPDRNHKAEVIGRALERWGCEGPDGRRVDPRQVRHMLARSWVDFAAARLAGGDTAGARAALRLALGLQSLQPAALKLLFKSLLPLAMRRRSAA